jgi:hypothetical protein
MTRPKAQGSKKKGVQSMAFKLQQTEKAARKAAKEVHERLKEAKEAEHKVGEQTVVHARRLRRMFVLGTSPVANLVPFHFHGRRCFRVAGANCQDDGEAKEESRKCLQVSSGAGDRGPRQAQEDVQEAASPDQEGPRQ